MRARIVIIGAGPAGVAAAVQCRRHGVDPWLCDQAGEAGGLVVNAYRIENLPGVAPCDGRALAASLRDHLSRFGVEVRPEAVHHVRHTPGGLVISTSEGDRQAGAAILAVGTRPIHPDLPGLGPSCRRLFFEVRELLASLPRPQSAIVLGGGEAALDYALSLSEAGAWVTVVVRGEAVRACQRLREAVAAVPGIRIAPRTRAVAYEEGDSKVALTVESDGTRSTLVADCLLAAVGRISRAADLLHASLGPMERGALVPFRGIPLFVAGDARHGGLGQVAMALGDGVAAARLAVEAVA